MVTRIEQLLTVGFIRINAFMVPSVYFFYPETAYRSLEEMDEIFQECHGFKGAFDVVKIAKEKPRRFGKDGNLLDLDDTERAYRRRPGAPGADADASLPRYQEAAEKSDDNTNTSEERREKV